MMNHVELITLTAKLNLKLQCNGRSYVIIVSIFTYDCNYNSPKHSSSWSSSKQSKNMIIKNWTPFINCISEINNSQTDNAKSIDIVMLIHNRTVIIILKHLGIYGITTEMNHFWMPMVPLLIFLLIIITECFVYISNKNSR